MWCWVSLAAGPRPPETLSRSRWRITCCSPLLTVVILLGIHSIVYTYFMATAKWAKEVVRVYQLPDGFVSQAIKNKRRAFRFVMGSMTTIAVATWLGGAADTRGSAYALWHLGAVALALAFNFGSFVVRVRRPSSATPALLSP